MKTGFKKAAEKEMITGKKTDKMTGKDFVSVLAGSNMAAGPHAGGLLPSRIDGEKENIFLKAACMEAVERLISSKYSIPSGELFDENGCLHERYQDEYNRLYDRTEETVKKREQHGTAIMRVSGRDKNHDCN